MCNLSSLVQEVNVAQGTYTIQIHECSSNVRTPDLEDEVPLSRILCDFYLHMSCFIKNVALVTKTIY